MANRDFEDEANKWRSTCHGQHTEQVVTSLYKRILILEERLNNIQPTEEQMDKYPSLRAAYEQFIIIKKLITENEK